jgi:site-specific recombinase XerD
MAWSPYLVRVHHGGVLVAVRLGHPLVDDYLAFVGARLRPNSWLAIGYDLKVFFTVVACEPSDVDTPTVFRFLERQRSPRRGRNVVRLEDAEQGLSARTIRRRLSSIAGLYDYLIIQGVVTRNPVPRGSTTRRRKQSGLRGRPLIRAPRTLPQVLAPVEVDAFCAALRTWRDRAMAEAMVFGGLRRCEVLGLRLEDVRPGERRVFIADGKGGHQRLVPVAQRFFASLARYLEHERPDSTSQQVFLVLKGRHRGQPLSAAGLDEIVDGARHRAEIQALTCHQLRHTCLTRLREAGMPLEAVQAQAGHRSIQSTRIYLHLSNEWLAAEYHQAAEAIDRDSADLLDRPGPPAGDRSAGDTGEEVR